MTLTLNSDMRRNDVRRDAETLMRDAHRLLDACGVVRGANWVARTVRAYVEAPVQVPFGLYLAARVELNDHQRKVLAERADLRYLLTYADPTGETAIRNVERERR